MLFTKRPVVLIAAALRPARHDDLKSYSVLVIENHPLVPTGSRAHSAGAIVGAARAVRRQSRARQSLASGPCKLN